MFKRVKYRLCFLNLCVAMVSILPTFTAYAETNVVVSIPPVHSLVSAVMKGAGAPALLIPGGQSPHSNSLKPSAIQRVGRADLLVWVSPDFELGLKKPAALRPDMRILTLIDEPEMKLLQTRHTQAWQVEEASHGHSNDSEATSTGVQNPDWHLWLSSENAIGIVRATARVLSEMDPENANLYRENGLQIIDKIGKTNLKIEQSLRPVKAVSYLVFHDAYHYFEREFGLSPVGSVTLSPEQKPGLRSLLAIKQNIAQHDVKCIFHEPQFQPRLVARIAEETGLRTGELDPIGAALKPGTDLWFELMLSLRENLLRCLQD